MGFATGLQAQMEQIQSHGGKGLQGMRGSHCGGWQAHWLSRTWSLNTHAFAVLTHLENGGPTCDSESSGELQEAWERTLSYCQSNQKIRPSVISLPGYQIAECNSRVTCFQVFASEQAQSIF